MAELKNRTEQYVDMNIDAVMAKIGCCTCEMCRLDVKAISLNNLPTKYVVSREGDVYANASSLQNQFDVDMLSKITVAAQTVKDNPRHQL